MSIDYSITIRGHLDDHWSAWFDGLTITNNVEGEATLVGPIVDQAALHALLAKLQDMGMPLISVQRLANDEADRQAAHGQPCRPPN